jgi:hypothetical protein
MTAMAAMRETSFILFSVALFRLLTLVFVEAVKTREDSEGL